MEWNGHALVDVTDFLDAITGVTSREEAQRFMEQYRVEKEHADSDIGYIAGYCDAETARRIWDWFGCAHPIFGTTVPLSWEDAFEAGRRAAASLFGEKGEP